MLSNSLDNKIDLVQVLESIPEACYFLSSDWEIDYINKAGYYYVELLEPYIHVTKDEIIGSFFGDLFSGFKGTDLYHTFQEANEEQIPKILEYQSRFLKRWFEIKIYPNENGLFVVLIDITDSKASEKQRQQFEKLHIIGEMAAGVAHEVRNPMTTVKGFLQLMAAENENEKFISRYNLMIGELNRVNDIITQFLDIAKDKPESLEHCSLNHVINAVLPLLETRALKEGKLLELHLSEDLPDLKIDKDEIRQLLLNLINNSLDAMDSGKTIEITTFKNNEHVVLSIKDEGSGIPPDIFDEITNPFFTTKETGTGLGIPICFSIAKRNNAKIDFTSSSEGTTFNIRFSK
jgi:signal transduction histidine kinase